jgi:hypothetical protein
MVWWRWEGVLVAFPIVSYGFTAHQYLFQIYPSSQRPNMKKMTMAVQRAMLLSAAIYVAVGACGYSAFGAKTSGDILRNFGGVGSSGLRLHAEQVLKYGFGVSLLGTIPLTVVPLHATVAPWLAPCSPAVEAAARQAEAAGVGGAGIQLSQLQESLLTAGILGEPLGGQKRGGGATLPSALHGACMHAIAEPTTPASTDIACRFRRISTQRPLLACSNPPPTLPPTHHRCAGSSCAVAALLPNVEFVFGLAGSTASTLMAFILPAAIFLNVTSSQRGMLGHSVDMLRGGWWVDLTIWLGAAA